MGLPALGIGAEKAPDGSLPESTLPVKRKVEEKPEWLVVGRAREKLQAVGSQSSEAPKGKEN